MNKARESPPATRCAIYTRKSTEEGLEQEFNSLDAQRDAGEAYIASQKHEGWVCLPDRYDDGGFIRGILEREATGASVRANTVMREDRLLFAAAIRQFKIWGAALRAAGLDPDAVSQRRRWTAERVIQAIRDLHARNIPLRGGSVKKIDQPLTQAAHRLLGSWDDALRAAGFDPATIRLIRRPWRKSEVIAAFEAHAASGGPMTPSGIRPKGPTWRRYACTARSGPQPVRPAWIT